MRSLPNLRYGICQFHLMSWALMALRNAALNVRDVLPLEQGVACHVKACHCITQKCAPRAGRIPEGCHASAPHNHEVARGAAQPPSLVPNKLLGGSGSRVQGWIRCSRAAMENAPRQHEVGRGAVQPLVAAWQAAAGGVLRAGAPPELPHQVGHLLAAPTLRRPAAALLPVYRRQQARAADGPARIACTQSESQW